MLKVIEINLWHYKIPMATISPLVKTEYSTDPKTFVVNWKSAELRNVEGKLIYNILLYTLIKCLVATRICITGANSEECAEILSSSTKKIEDLPNYCEGYRQLLGLTQTSTMKSGVASRAIAEVSTFTNILLYSCVAKQRPLYPYHSSAKPALKLLSLSI